MVERVLRGFLQPEMDRLKAFMDGEDMDRCVCMYQVSHGSEWNSYPEAPPIILDLVKGIV